MADWGAPPAPWAGFSFRQRVDLPAAMSGTSASVKGGWYQAVASTSYGSNLLGLVLYPNDTTGNSVIDIGIGASGSEQVLVPDVWMYQPTNGVHFTPIWLPVNIPAGARLSVRMVNENDTVLDVPGFMLLYHSTQFGMFAGESRMAAYGVAAPLGTVLPSGSWTEITSGTSRFHRGLWLLNHDSATDDSGTIELGYGASGSEISLQGTREIVTRGYYGHDTGDMHIHFPVTVQGGTRLAAKWTLAGGSGTHSASILGY